MELISNAIPPQNPIVAGGSIFPATGTSSASWPEKRMTVLMSVWE
jgi:hypothetical protein